ncbi:MAG: murein biosynthesis integral membrane protein MurJ [Phycisphaerae bacterium]
MCSRVLGLVRESVFSHFFGTSQLLSAFRIAFMAPNLARRLFGEGALSSAMIPAVTRSLREKGEEESRRFFGTLLTLQVAVLGVGVVAAEIVIAVWRTLNDDPALELSALLIPYMVLICTVAVAGGVLNARGHFAAPATAPVILNAAVIAGTVGGAVWVGLTGMSLMYAVCGSVLVAGVGQLLLAGVVLRAVSFFPILGGSWRDPQIRVVAAQMAPMVLGLSAVQLNTLVDYLIAYLFITEDGVRVGPAVLGYAQYLYQLPLGVFGISLATAIFPILSQRAASADTPGMAATVSAGLRLALFIALPASVGLVIVAEPLVATLFEHGVSDARATQRIAGTLVFYCIGLWAYFAQHVLARAFYALQDGRTPARIAMVMVSVNFVINLALVFPLEERGLALATAVCAIAQAVWLYRRLRAVLPPLTRQPMRASVSRTLLATTIMTLALITLGSPHILPAVVASTPALRLVLLVALGLTVYAAAAHLLRAEELHWLLRPKRAPGIGSGFDGV